MAEVQLRAPANKGGWSLGGWESEERDESSPASGSCLSDEFVRPWNVCTDYSVLTSKLPGALVGGLVTVQLISYWSFDIHRATPVFEESALTDRRVHVRFTNQYVPYLLNLGTLKVHSSIYAPCIVKA